MNDSPIKLAVLGPSQSGKTCLAVGLSAVNTAGYTVVPGALNVDLGKLTVDLENHHWPAPNIPDRAADTDVKEIALKLQKEGKKPIPLSFLEYAGERLQDPDAFKAFANKHLDGLDGAVVLVNPGADAFAGDAAQRQKALEHYQRLFARLCEMDKKPFVALTVTAADRLVPGGDLGGRAGAFNEFVEQLENTLKTSPLRKRWKRFGVTITGCLEKQEEPSLAKGRANTSAKPFLWLLYRLRWLPPVMRVVRAVGLSLAALAAIGVIWYGVAREVAKRGIEKSARELEELINEFGAIGTPTDDQLGRVAKAMEELERPLSFRIPLILAAVGIPTDGQLVDVNSRFERLLSQGGGLAGDVVLKKARKLEPKVWDLFKRRIEHEIRAIKTDIGRNATPAAVQRVDELFGQFVPTLTEAAAEHEALRTKWTAERNGLLEQNIVQILIDVVEKPIDRLVGSHGEAVLVSLLELYGELVKVLPQKGAERLIAEKARVSEKLDKRVSEEFLFLIERDLGRGVPQDEATETSKRFAEQLSVWNPASKAGADRKENVEKLLKSKTGDATKQWLENQRQSCEEWVKNEISNQPKRATAGQNGLFAAYVQFARRNAQNPFFMDVVQKSVYARVEKSFEENVAWFEKNGGKASFWSDTANFATNWKTLVTRLQAFRQLCSEVADDATPRQSSWAWHFARLCMKEGRLETNKQAEYFPRRVVIERIDASADYHGKLPTAYKHTAFGAKIDIAKFNDNGTLADNRPEVLLPFERDGSAKDSGQNAVKAHKKKRDGKKTKTLLSQRRMIDIHAFERVDLKLVATDWNSGTGGRESSPVKTISLAWAEAAPFVPSGTTFDLSFKLNRWSGDKKPDLTLTIRGRIEGSSIRDYLSQAKDAAKAVK